MFGLDAVPDGLPPEEGLDRTMVSGDVLFAGSIGRTDLPGGDHAAMQRSLRDVVLPLPDSTLVLTGHGAGHDDAPRAGHQPLPARIDRVNAPATKVTPISGFPEFLPAERLLELHFLDVIREVFELHGFASLETRAVEPVERLLGKGDDADKEIYGISRLAGDDSGRDAALGPALRPHRARSPATCSRTPASSPSRSAATRSRRSGAASGRRRGASASSPRPTSTSSTSASSPRTSRPRCRSSSPRRSAACRSGSSASRSTTARSPRASTSASGSPTSSGTLRIVDRLDAIGADKVTRDARSSPAPPRSRRARCWHWPSIRSTRPLLRGAVRALGVQHPTLDEGLDALAAVIARRHGAGARGARRRPADRPRARLLHRHGLRDPARRVRVVGLGLLRRALRLAGHRRSHDLPRRRHLDRAVPGSCTCSSASAGSPRSRSTPAAVLVAVIDEESPRGRPDGWRRRCGRAASRARWRPARRSSASRSATPTGAASRSSGSRAAGEGGDQVKDIRSGEQVDADAATWQCPPEDLRPAVVTP